jgi:hypothetical protein
VLIERVVCTALTMRESFPAATVLDVVPTDFVAESPNPKLVRICAWSVEPMKVSTTCVTGKSAMILSG